MIPDGPLHGEVSLYVLDVLLGERLAAAPLLQRLVQHPLPPPPPLVLLLVRLLVPALPGVVRVTGAHGHRAVRLAILTSEEIITPCVPTLILLHLHVSKLNFAEH